MDVEDPRVDNDETPINKLPEEILERIFSYTSQYK